MVCNKESLENRVINLSDGLYTVSLSNEKPKLIGSMCNNCGEIYFPQKLRKHCIHCYKDELVRVELDGRGVISNYTRVHQKPAGGFYNGPIPYTYGFVDLRDGVRIESLLKGDENSIRIGQQAEIIIDVLYRDENGNDIVTYMFTPIENS